MNFTILLWDSSPIYTAVWMRGSCANSPPLDNNTGPSLHLIMRNVPQSDVTELNWSNVVTVTVFGNSYEEKIPQLYTE